MVPNPSRPLYDTVHAACADGCSRLRFRTGPSIKASIHWLSLRRKPAVPLNVTRVREAAERTLWSGFAQNRENAGFGTNSAGLIFQKMSQNSIIRSLGTSTENAIMIKLSQNLKYMGSGTRVFGNSNRMRVKLMSQSTQIMAFGTISEKQKV